MTSTNLANTVIVHHPDFDVEAFAAEFYASGEGDKLMIVSEKVGTKGQYNIWETVQKIFFLPLTMRAYMMSLNSIR